MKPPERFPPDDPREWLNRARSNLAQARNEVDGAYPGDLCFEAQQAYVHDIARLPRMPEADGAVVPEDIERAAEPTRYATFMRYPGTEEPMSSDTVIGWAEEQM